MTELLNQFKDKGIKLKLVGGTIYYNPKSAVTADMLQLLRQFRQQIMVYLIRQEGKSISVFNNPPECHNPFTSHSSHEYWWECDPNSCHCYQVYGYPHACQGVPCRWVWLKE